MEQEQFRARRRSRLRAEIADAGLGLRLDGPGGDALLAEIDYARFPPVHEGEFPTYGAVLVATSSSSPEEIGALVQRAAPGAEDVVRLMADGRQGFLLRRGGRIALMVLPTPHDGEGDMVRLREQFGRGRFAAVQRLAGGVVRVFGRSAISVWDGSHWWEKPYSGVFARAVLRAMPDASAAATEAVLEFCVHSMSPAPAGATLVWALDPSLADQLSDGRARRVPSLSLENRTTHGPLRQLLSQVDGAALLSADGSLLDVGLYLRASPSAYAAVVEDPTHGTRHSSARRFSFDNRRALVFVVSHDGPVTVYLKGRVVASIRSRLEEQPLGGDPPGAAVHLGGGRPLPPIG
jgi:DNA integrity scanning protein DisA with diadenylate cyclase activity